MVDAAKKVAGALSDADKHGLITGPLGLKKSVEAGIRSLKDKGDRPQGGTTTLQEVKRVAEELEKDLVSSVRVVVGYLDRADEMTVVAALGLHRDDLTVGFLSEDFVKKQFGNTRWSTLRRINDQRAVLVYDATGEAPQEASDHILSVVGRIRELTGNGDKKVTVVLVGDPESLEYKHLKEALESAGVRVIDASDLAEGYDTAKENKAQLMVTVGSTEKKTEERHGGGDDRNRSDGQKEEGKTKKKKRNDDEDRGASAPRRRRREYPPYFPPPPPPPPMAVAWWPDNANRYSPPPPSPPPPALWMGGANPMSNGVAGGRSFPNWPPPGGGGSGGGMLPVATRVGGVRLDRTATVLGEIGEIHALCFDRQSGRLVLLGTKGKTGLPAMRLDDLAVVIHSIYVEGIDPYLSIDPKIGDLYGPKMDVRYSPGLLFSHAGRTMYLTDYKLKEYAAGGRAGKRLTCSVPGYRSLGQIEEDLPASEKEKYSVDSRIWFRFWLVPNEIRLAPSGDGHSLAFERASVRVETENMILKNGRLVRVEGVKDPVAEKFARRFTENYDKFAAEYPAYEELRRLAQIVGLVKWMHKNGVDVDLSWVERHRGGSAVTPLETDSVWSEQVTRDGSGRLRGERVHRFFGGVVMSMKVRTLSSQEAAADRLRQILKPEQVERLRALMQTVRQTPERETWRPANRRGAWWRRVYRGG